MIRRVYGDIRKEAQSREEIITLCVMIKKADDILQHKLDALNQYVPVVKVRQEGPAKVGGRR